MGGTVKKMTDTEMCPICAQFAAFSLQSTRRSRVVELQNVMFKPEDIKPCRFCQTPCQFNGGVWRSGGCDSDGWYEQVACMACGARGPIVRSGSLANAAAELSEAINLWNNGVNSNDGSSESNPAEERA